MSSYQKITLVGRLGKDPTMKYTDEGTAVTEFSLAVNERSRPAKGKKRATQTTVWFEITCWDKLAETVAQHLNKGRLVLIEGKMKSARAWLDRSGEPRCNLEVTARDVQFLDSKHEADFEAEYEEDIEEKTPPPFRDPVYDQKEEDYDIEDVDLIPYS